MTSFLQLTPSMKTLVWLAESAPAEIALRVSLSEARTPGASAATLRKLRALCEEPDLIPGAFGGDLGRPRVATKTFNLRRMATGVEPCVRLR